MSKEPEDITPGEVPPAPGYSAPAGDVPAPGHAAPPAPGYAAPPAPGYAAPPPGAVPPAPGYAVPPAPGYAAPPPAYGAPQGYAGAGAPISDSDQRMWAILSHLGGVFVSFVVPLVVYLIYKGRGMFVEDQAKEALNFQITLLIAYTVSGLSMFVLIGFLLFPAVAICAIVFAIIAAVKSNQGILYRYPVSIRFIK